MNKKGQGGILSLFFVLGVFILVWVFFLAAWLAQIGADAITTNSLTGLEAFLWGNLNLWVLVGVIALGAGGLFFATGAQQ